jgi:hypothetical protein
MELLAPNGNPSNLTPEQYRLVRTPAFISWFGDWENSPENSSKVVDENGEPLVVYHGTTFDFNEFKKDKPTIGAYGQGLYFSSSKSFASDYARGDNGKVLSIFLNIRKTFVINNDVMPKGYENYSTEKMLDNKGVSRDFTKNIVGKYDGVKAIDRYGDIEFVVFEPTQIKLADGSNITFDSNNPDIRFDNGGETNNYFEDNNSEEISFSNFHLNTIADFSSIYRSEVPSRKPDFISDSGSKYWYDGEYVIRQADHWGELGECTWTLDLKPYSGLNQGKCLLSDFKTQNINMEEGGNIKNSGYSTEMGNMILPIGTIVTIYGFRSSNKYEIVEFLGEQENVGNLYDVYELKADKSGIKGKKTRIRFPHPEAKTKFKFYAEIPNEGSKLISQSIIDSEKRRGSQTESIIKIEGDKPTYLMTKDEYKSIVTPKIKEFNKFIEKNKEYFSRVEYNGFDYLDFESFKGVYQPRKYSSVEGDFLRGKGFDSNSEYKPKQASPELIEKLNSYKDYFSTIFGEENLKKIEHDENTSNKRSIRRAIDSGIYENLLREGKINYTFLKNVFDSVGVNVPTKLEKIEAEVVEKGITSDVKKSIEDKKESFIIDLKMIFSKEVRFYADKFKGHYFDSIERMDKFCKAHDSFVNYDAFARAYSLANDFEPKPVFEEKRGVKVIVKYEYHPDINQISWFTKIFYTVSSSQNHVKYAVADNWKELLEERALDYSNALFQNLGERILSETDFINKINNDIPTLKDAKVHVLTQKGFETNFSLLYSNGFIFNVETQVIYAGGYNIQALHLRALFKFNYKGKFISKKEILEAYKSFNGDEKTFENGGLIINEISIPENIDALLKEKYSLDNDVSFYSDEWNKIIGKRDDMGLVPDEVRKSDEYIRLKTKYKLSFKKFQDFNQSDKNKTILNFTKKLDRVTQQKIRNHYSGKIEMQKGGDILLAPNGKKSNLTPEQYKLVRSPEFISWFGDWINEPENASKVIDENGEPMVVWHGTKEIADNFIIIDREVVFKPKFNKFSTIIKNEKGIYFSPNKKIAEGYGTAIAYFLKIKNLVQYENVVPDNYAKSEGIYRMRGSAIGLENAYEIAVFNSNQIKLADGSNTTFDGSNSDVRFDKGGEFDSCIIKVKAKMSNGGELKIDKKKVYEGDKIIREMPLNEVEKYIGIYHEQEGNIFFAKNRFLIWFYDTTDFAPKINNGEYDFLMFPNRMKGFSFNSVGIIDEIWTSKWQNKFKGAKNLLGMVQGYYDEANNKIVIHFMSVRPSAKRNHINSFMIQYAKKVFNSDDVVFHEPTEQGQSFIDSNKFEQGGGLKNKIKVQVDYDLLAPNGKPSNLTPEQYKLVRSPEFISWFGNWIEEPENSSKIIDENGEPLVCYHKTNNKFTIFDKEKLGSSSGWDTAYFGFYFSNKYEKTAYGKIAIKCFLNIKNPYYIISETYSDFDYDYKKFDVNNFSENDGVIIKTNRLILGDKADKHFVAFESNQIKLSNGTNTTFDGSNPDIRFEDGGTMLLAPNGKPSKLSEVQYKLVRTPEFISWFGDWENSPETASKIVDENGEPKVCFHRSKKDFYFFDNDKQLNGWLGKGFYFSDNKFEFKDYGKKILSVFLNIRNPFKVKGESPSDFLYELKQMFDSDKFNTTEILKVNKYDGIIYKHWDYEGNMFVCFESNQIKLAHGSNTTFDSNNPDIRFDNGGDIEKLAFIQKNENGFYWLYSINDEGDYYKEVDGDKRLYVVKDMAKRWGYKLVTTNEFNDYYKIPERVRRFNDGGEIESLKIIIENVKNENKYKGAYKLIFDIIEENVSFYNPYGTINEELIGTDFKIEITPIPDSSIIQRIQEIPNVKIVDSFKNGGSISFDKVISASTRFRPTETVVFDPPLEGKNGAKLISYTWSYEWTMTPNREGELKSKRISDWTQAEISADTGRDIVHQYTILMPDGEYKTVSSDSVPVLLGYLDKKELKSFPNLVTASKTLAKQQMQLAILEAQKKEYDDLYAKFEKAEKPEIKEVGEDSKFSAIIESYKKGAYSNYAMGDVIYRQDNEYVYGSNDYKKTPISRTTIEQLTWAWISKRVEENGGVNPRGLYDLKNRVARQKRKVENILNSKMENGGTINENIYEHLYYNGYPKEYVDSIISLILSDKVKSDIDRIEALGNMGEFKDAHKLCLDLYKYLSEQSPLENGSWGKEHHNSIDKIRQSTASLGYVFHEGGKFIIEHDRNNKFKLLDEPIVRNWTEYIYELKSRVNEYSGKNVFDLNELKFKNGGVVVGEEMADNKFPTLDEAYDIIENEESNQGGVWIAEEDSDYSEDAKFQDKEQAMLYVKEIYGFMESISDDDFIPVYRCVSAEEVDLDPYSIGESWSIYLDSAKEFGRHLGEPLSNLKIISGYVPKENVDWEQAIKLYHLFSDSSSSESEFELPIPSNNKILNVTVSNFKDAKELPEYNKNYKNGGDIVGEEIKNKIINILKTSKKYSRYNIDEAQNKEYNLIKLAINQNNYFGRSVRKANENYLFIPLSIELNVGYGTDKRVDYMYFPKPNSNTKIKIVSPEPSEDSTDDEKEELKKYIKPILYDSSLVNENNELIDNRYINIFDYEELDSSVVDEEHLYRGMSSLELDNIISNKYIKSDASMNLQGQEETTSFAQYPSQASSYAFGFTAWYDDVTFENPKYVIKIKREGLSYKPALENEPKNEVDVYGKIPLSNVVDIYEIRLGVADSGSLTLKEEFDGNIQEGSRSPIHKKAFVRKLSLKELELIIGKKYNDGGDVDSNDDSYLGWQEEDYLSGTIVGDVMEYMAYYEVSDTFPETERFILSHEEKIILRDKTQDSKDTFKPKGLWYAFGMDWFKGVAYVVPSMAGNYKYVHKLKVTDKVCSIKTIEEAVKFTDKYGVGEGHFYKRYLIDWSKVEKDYSGVEALDPVRWCRTEGFEAKLWWLYSWDAASGCIWKEDGIESIDNYDYKKQAKDFHDELDRELNDYEKSQGDNNDAILNNGGELQKLEINNNDIKVGLNIIQKKWGGNTYKITKVLPNNTAYIKADVRGNYGGSSTAIRTFDEIKNNYIKLIKDDNGKALGFDYKNGKFKYHEGGNVLDKINPLTKDEFISELKGGSRIRVGTYTRLDTGGGGHKGSPMHVKVSYVYEPQHKNPKHHLSKIEDKPSLLQGSQMSFTSFDSFDDMYKSYLRMFKKINSDKKENGGFLNFDEKENKEIITDYSKKIKVYRGIGNNVYDEENDYVIWVAEDRRVAENYSKNGNVIELEVQKPLNPFEIPFNNIYVKGSDIGDRLTSIVNERIQDDILGNVDIDEEKYKKILDAIAAFVEKSGEKSELYSHKTNNKESVGYFVKALQLLGYDGLIQKESYSSESPYTTTRSKDESITYGIFRNSNPDVSFKDGGKLTNPDEKDSIYKDWKELVNMSYSELKSFYDSEEGKVAGLKKSEADELGIHSGRESARWIMKMKKTKREDWTNEMWAWAKRQIGFVKRMSGAKGDLIDEKGNKTRKYLSLLIWGNNPKKSNNEKKMFGGIFGSKKLNYSGRVFVGKDNNWRFEFSDHKAKLLIDINDILDKKINNIPLIHFIQHRELFKAYPELRDVKVVFKSKDDYFTDNPKMYDFKGEFNIFVFSLAYNKTTDLDKQILIYIDYERANKITSTEMYNMVLRGTITEVQHAIQQTEGFGEERGLSYFVEKEQRKYARVLKEVWGKITSLPEKSIERIQAEADFNIRLKEIRENARLQYENQLLEIESIESANRIKLNKSQRDSNPSEIEKQ